MPATNKTSQSDFTIFEFLIRTNSIVCIHTIQPYTMWYNSKIYIS